MKRKLILTAVTTAIAIGLAGGASFAIAQQGKLTGNAVKIGVLTDMSGVYADYGGPGAVAAARMAVADFGGTMFGMPIEVVSADHQNKPDIAKNVAQGWFDRDGVDISVENLNSAVALAVQALAARREARPGRSPMPPGALLAQFSAPAERYCMFFSSFLFTWQTIVSYLNTFRSLG